MSISTQNIPGQTGDTVVIGGATYAIATDWGSGGGTGFTGNHVQIVKPAWGDNYNTRRVSKLDPLPVQIFDGNQGTTGALIDGNSNSLKVTGSFKITDKIELEGSQVDGYVKPMVTGIVQIVGPTFGKSGPTGYSQGLVNEKNFAPIKVTGSVQGYTGMYPLSVTFGGGLDKAKPETSGPGQIRRLYGGPLGYTGATGYELTTQNRKTLARHIDYVAVQGMHHGTPIGITGTTGGLRIRKLRYPANGIPSSLETPFQGNTDGDRVGVIGIQGATAVGITGGVRVSHIPSGGSFEIRNLVSGRDSVAVWGADGSTAAHVKIFDSNGQPLGVSGNGALKVAIDNGVFTGTVNLSTNVYVKNATGEGLKVRGITGDEVVVKGPLSGGAIEVASPSGLNIRALNTTDKISLGGDVAEDIESLNSSVTSVNDKLNTINNRMAVTNNLVDALQSIVSRFESLGSQPTMQGGSTADGIMFNTCIKRINQPSELISIVVTTGSSARIVGKKDVYNGVYLQADASNTNNILIGGTALNSGSSGYTLEPGESIFLQISNLNKIYARSANAGNQTLRVIGS